MRETQCGGSFDLVFPTQTAIKEVSGLKVEHAVVDFSPDQDNGLLLPAVQTGGVSVASGDVNGDNSALGDPVTFTLTVRPDGDVLVGAGPGAPGGHVKVFDGSLPPVPNDDGSDENFVYGGPENADGHAGQKGAWVADVSVPQEAA
jgi:hypothetical protein